MEIQLTGKNIEITPPVRDYVERKLGKLSRHLPNIIESKVEVTEEKTKSPGQRYVVQVTVNSSGVLLRGEERGQDIFIAINRVAEVMDTQIKRYKGKRFDKKGGTSLARGAFETVEAPARPGGGGEIIKIKKFTIKPMSPDEAVEQMELLGHDFFVFFNADTEKINLVYRRKDDNYGLIEPEVG